jgi:hypothetical protein
LEAEFYELDRSLGQTKRVRLQADFISNDFEFYEIGLKQLAGQACRLHGFPRGEAPGCIGQDRPPALPKQIPE